MLFFLLSFFSLFFITGVLSGETPYYLRSGGVQVGLNYKLFVLSDTYLSSPSLSFSYGVNERVLLKVDVPYLFFEDDYQDGILGDIYLLAKLLIEKDFEERWSVSFAPIFRFPTGVVKEESYRYVNGHRVSFYPFSYGIFAFYPGFNFSIFIPPLMLWANLYYCNENSRNEDLLSFNSSFDMLEIDLNVDFIYELNLFSNLRVYYQPQLAFLYRYNLSGDVIFSDGFEVYFSNILKFGNFFRFRLRFLYPINQENSFYKYSFDSSVIFIF